MLDRPEKVFIGMVVAILVLVALVAIFVEDGAIGPKPSIVCYDGAGRVILDAKSITYWRRSPQAWFIRDKTHGDRYTNGTCVLSY